MFALTVGVLSLVAPLRQTSTRRQLSASVRMSDEPAAAPAEPVAPAVPSLNGWTYDKNAFCGGLPGSIAPLGQFDPAGFSSDKSMSEIKRLRESEVMHGRVAMLAVIGYFVGEAVAPLLGGSFLAPTAISGPANSHLAQQNIFAFSVLTIAIGVGELYRALVGWVPPTESAFTIRENYYPGDIGFDPLGMKPKDAAEFKAMQERELSNGRLAMFAAAGLCGQELATNKGILESLFSS